jgi:hypothetical protein
VNVARVRELGAERALARAAATRVNGLLRRLRDMKKLPTPDRLRGTFLTALSDELHRLLDADLDRSQELCQRMVAVARGEAER